MEEDKFPITNVGNDDWEGIAANPAWFYLGTDPSLALVLIPFDCAQGRLVEWIRMTIREIPGYDRRNDGGVKMDSR